MDIMAGLAMLLGVNNAGRGGAAQPAELSMLLDEPDEEAPAAS